MCGGWWRLDHVVGPVEIGGLFSGDGCSGGFANEEGVKDFFGGQLLLCLGDFGGFQVFEMVQWRWEVAACNWGDFS